MIRRIRTQKEYLEFSKAERVIRTRYFKLQILSDPAGPALGITISKKVASAVYRNLLKRRLKAWFYAHRHSLSPKLKMNIIAQRGAAELSWAQLCTELEALLPCIV